MRKRRKITPKLEASNIANHKGLPAAILAADDHIRNGSPECRTDNYVEAIFRKLEYRNKIAIKYNIPILHAGDVGDKNYFVKDGNGWTAEVYNRFISIMKEVEMWVVYGNHDLPGHDVENISRSVLGGLVDSGSLLYLEDSDKEISPGVMVDGYSWDEKIEPDIVIKNSLYKNVLCIHKMIINQLPLWPGQEAPKAIDILKQNPDYNLIVSGDNHNTFTAEYDGRLLVNCGSMMRSTTKQFDHKPCFFLYYPESNTVEKIFYPIEPAEQVMSLKHIENKNQNTERVEKYAELVNKADLSELLTFKENSEIFISGTKTISGNVINYIRGFVNNEQPIKQHKQQAQSKAV